MKKPVIAAVNGVAAGAGASLALACDLRVMADDASMLMAFSNIALVPDAGATWLLARLVGYSRAYEIAIEGQRVRAERCLELGLTNKVVPANYGGSNSAIAYVPKTVISHVNHSNLSH